MKIREYRADLHNAWQVVKQNRLLRLRGEYVFDHKSRLYVNPFGRLVKGAQRIFYDEKRDGAAGFAEFFAENGAPQYIEFYNDDGAIIARMDICVNPAEFYFHPVKLD